MASQRGRPEPRGPLGGDVKGRSIRGVCVFSSASPPPCAERPDGGCYANQSDTTVVPGANVERVAGKGIFFDCTRRCPNPDGLHAKGLGKQVGTLCARPREEEKSIHPRFFTSSTAAWKTTAAALRTREARAFFLHNDNTTMSLFNFSGGGDIWSSAGFAFVR